RARLLLKKGKAAIFRRFPFTIILEREIENPQIPDLRLKCDGVGSHRHSVDGERRTGDIVSANIPRGKFAGKHFGRVAIRQRKSFVLNGFDVNPGYIARAHFADGYGYEYRTQNVG
ncbi:MAG TPA: RRXRR domain-containing protein, partial [Blastocatellia bacterium]|nr:RRXRR domain-containing protein [Blastocatellia bacterium]